MPVQEVQLAHVGRPLVSGLVAKVCLLAPPPTVRPTCPDEQQHTAALTFQHAHMQHWITSKTHRQTAATSCQQAH